MFPRVTVANPKTITIVVEVPIDTPFAELAKARQAALDALKNNTNAAQLPPVDVVVQYER